MVKTILNKVWKFIKKNCLVIWNFFKKKKVYISILVIIFLIFSYLFIWCLPLDLLENSGLCKEQYYEQVNKYRTTFATIIGGIGGLILLGVHIYRSKIFAKQVENQSEKIKEERRSNISRETLDQYVKAVEQLKDESIPIKLGGIYSFNKIMKSNDDESKEYRDMIIGMLCAYVREYRKFDNKKNIQENFKEISADIKAIIEILKDGVNRMNKNIDLQKTNWIEADLSDMDLSGFDLFEAHFEKAILAKTYLENTNLRFAHLEGASLIDAHLENATLISANLEGANLAFTHLENADLSNAKLENAILSRTHFDNTDLSIADFKNIILGSLGIMDTTKENINNFIIELKKAKEIYGIQLDDEIMKFIEDKFPELYKRITGDYPKTMQ